MLIHVVTAGETLWQIAQKYHVDTEVITRLNGLPNPNQLLIGQSLVIPSPNSSYIVKKGDTLWLIANMLGVSMQSIIEANQLVNPNFLLPGSKLLIPQTTHTIEEGETLSQIANRYGTTVQAILIENQLMDADMIYPGVDLIIPPRKPLIDVNAYTYQPEEEAVNSLNSVGRLLTYFSPFAYTIQADGTLEGINDQRMIEAAISEQIVPMLTITNFSSTETGSQLAHTILSSPGLSEETITHILQVMDEKGYTVLNVDFENVLPADKENYNRFLQMAANRLHPKGYQLSSALAPKTSATQPGLLYEAQDYAAHGRIADFVILMTYEWGYRLGPPQAISPINNMREVVEFALSVMPPEKIFLGFQIYARDWLLPHVQGQEAETFSQQEAIRRATEHGATIQYDTTAQSPYFHYVDDQGREHEVWFEDARSAQAKFDLIKQYNLRGVSYWALGYPFPQNWVLIDANFTIRKRIS